MGTLVDPAVARAEANAVFRASPISASMSGLMPRLIGVGFKRIPKFGFLLGISYLLSEGEQPGMWAATGASIPRPHPFDGPLVGECHHGIGGTAKATKVDSE